MPTNHNEHLKVIFTQYFSIWYRLYKNYGIIGVVEDFRRLLWQTREFIFSLAKMIYKTVNT